MNRTRETLKKRVARQRRIRARITGTKERPRLSVFRSNRYVYAQLIDDEARKTLASVSSRGISQKGKTKTTVAGEIGKALAEKASKLGITRAVFDKGGYQYHGRIKEFAESVRSGGITI